MALPFVDGEFWRVVASQPEAQTYLVGIDGGEVTERSLESAFLLGG